MQSPTPAYSPNQPPPHCLEQSRVIQTEEHVNYHPGPVIRATHAKSCPTPRYEEYVYSIYGTNLRGDIAKVNQIGYNSKRFSELTAGWQYEFREYMPGIKQFTTDDPIRSTNNWRTLTGGYNDPVNYVDLLGLSAGAIALRGLGSRLVPGLGQALLLMDIYNHANERNEVRQAYLDAGGHWKDLQPKSKPMVEMKPDGSVGLNLDLTFPPTNEEIKQRTNELLKKPLASSNINIDVDRMIKDAINPKSGGEQKNEPDPANKQGPDPEPKVPIPPLGDDDDDDDDDAFNSLRNQNKGPDIDKINRDIQKDAYGKNNNIGQTPEEAIEELTETEVGNVNSIPIRRKGDKTPRGRTYTDHGAKRANKRGFTDQIIDNIIENNRKGRVKQTDPEDGMQTWRYQDKRGNTVIVNMNDEIVTTYSHPEYINDGNYIPKCNR